MILPQALCFLLGWMLDAAHVREDLRALRSASRASESIQMTLHAPRFRQADLSLSEGLPARGRAGSNGGLHRAAPPAGFMAGSTAVRHR